MIRVFIYYMQTEILKEIQEAVLSYFREERHAFKLTSCSRYGNAAAYLREPKNQDDVYLLDFSEAAKGQKLASWLRERDERASWAGVGGSLREFLPALLFRPSGYIENPEDSAAVCSLLSKLDRYHREYQKKNYFSFKCQGDQVRIPYEEIEYFESSAKKVTLHRPEGKQNYCFTARLDDIAEMLPFFFLRCHQSYLVNLNRVRSLDTKAHVFLLHSGEEIWISRRMYAEARESYQKFAEAEARG